MKRYNLPKKKEDIYVVVDRFKIKKDKMRETLSESIEVTLKKVKNRLVIINAETNEQ